MTGQGDFEVREAIPRQRSTMPRRRERRRAITENQGHCQTTCRRRCRCYSTTVSHWLASGQVAWKVLKPSLGFIISVCLLAMHKNIARSKLRDRETIIASAKVVGVLDRGYSLADFELAFGKDRKEARKHTVLGGAASTQLIGRRYRSLP